MDHATPENQDVSQHLTKCGAYPGMGSIDRLFTQSIPKIQR